VPAALLIALVLQASAPAAPPPASISGRVTDKASAQPLARIVVTLYPADPSKRVKTLTDKDGRYEFGYLGPGKYSIGADNDEHVSTYLEQWFGAEEPADPSSGPPPPTLTLANGEARPNVDLALTRALAIEGHVVDPFGDPVNGAEVSVTTTEGRVVTLGSSVSDDLGAYRIFGLRPGRYRVCATGQRRIDAPGDGSTLARTCYPASVTNADAAAVALTSQDVFSIDVRAQWADPPRAASETSAVPVTQVDGAIRGIVTDKQTGRPIPRAIVRLAFRGPTRTLNDMSTTTDENGVFAFVGLAAGPYDGFVVAPRHLLAPLTDPSGARPLTVRSGQPLEVAAALAGGYAMNVRLVDAFDTPLSGFGVSVRSADDGRLAVVPYEHASDDLGRIRASGLAPGRYVVCVETSNYAEHGRATEPSKPDRLVRTCYPSTTDEAQAQPITIANADVEDVELRVMRGRALSIAGTIVDASGAPAPQAIVSLSLYKTDEKRSMGFQIERDGRFRIANVRPGSYAIEATVDGQAALIPIRIDEGEVENLVVAMRKTVNVRGRVALENSTAAVPDNPGRAPIQISARLADERLPGDGSSSQATANSDGTFTLDGLFGRRRIEVLNAPSGWFVKAIRYGQTDIIDTPAEFKNGDRPIDVVLANRGASISGTVAEVVDHRAARAQVFLLRAATSDADVPRLAASILSATGNYSFGPLREGEYVIVAVPADVPLPRPGDWDRLAQLSALGERVTVADLDRRTIDLHVTAVR